MKIVLAITVLLLHYTGATAGNILTVETRVTTAAYGQLFADNASAGEKQDDISAHWQQKNAGMKLRAWRAPSQLPALDENKRQYRIIHTTFITERPAMILPHLKQLLFPNHYFW